MLAQAHCAFHRLERNVSRKAIRHDDIGLAGHQVGTLDKANIVERARAQ